MTSIHSKAWAGIILLLYIYIFKLKFKKSSIMVLRKISFVVVFNQNFRVFAFMQTYYISFRKYCKITVLCIQKEYSTAIKCRVNFSTFIFKLESTFLIQTVMCYGSEQYQSYSEVIFCIMACTALRIHSRENGLAISSDFWTYHRIYPCQKHLD